MGLARFIRLIGLFSLVAGIIGFLLPGQFIYFPTLDLYLTRYGNALFPGIGANPDVRMLIAKAPVIVLAITGLILLFWGCIRQMRETDEADAKKIKGYQ